MNNSLSKFIFLTLLVVPVFAFAQNLQIDGGLDSLITNDPIVTPMAGVNDDNGLVPKTSSNTGSTSGQIDTSILREPAYVPPTVVYSDSKSSTDLSAFDSLTPASTFGGQPLSNLLNQIFYIGLAIAVILAIVMIVRGGIQYMTIDSFTSKESGKKMVQAAIGGLVLAFAGILILNTINPKLTDLNLSFDPLSQIGIIKGSTGLTSGTRATSTTSTGGYNNAITPTSEGYTATPGRVAVDTDGINPPPYDDPTRQSQTSLPGLDANVDNYVVVPIGSDIPLGTKVKMTNADTGKTAWGVVGDRGPTANGLGEISLSAARELGAWTDGMGDSAKQHKITYTFYTNE